MIMYNLEDRTLVLAISVRDFLKQLPQNTANSEDSKQLIRSSGSIGANYIEANQSLSRKDFIMHMRISRKEAKESVFWLNILLKSNHLNQELNSQCIKLISETTEIKKILSAIINKSL